MPVVTIGHNTADDYAGIEDTYLRHLFTNYSTSQAIDLLNTTALRAGCMRVTGLSNIPVNATISVCQLYLWPNLNVGGVNTIDIHRLLRPWNINNVTAFYYDNPLAWDSTYAQTDGVDRVSLASGTIVLGAAGAYYVSTDLSADAQDFVSGALQNDGWLMTPQSGASLKNVRSSDNTGDGTRPYVLVDYAVLAGGAYRSGLTLMGVG